jgi:D-glycero-D-manno-heptose 1,7-bisphosphate phosphatase
MNLPASGSRRAAFLDRDGVINIDLGYVSRREDFRFVAGVLDGARKLHELGFVLVVVTNQSGIGRGLYTEAQFGQLNEWMLARFEAARAPIAATYFCPHHPSEAFGSYLRTCDCRKPAPGLLLRAAGELGLDLSRSALFGDKETDLLAARAAGVPLRILLGTDGAATPPMPQSDGLATGAYRQLDEALSDTTLLTALRLERQPAG